MRVSIKEDRKFPLSFEKRYHNLSPYLHKTRVEVTSIIQGHLSRIGDRYLARVRLVEARVKDLEPLKEKIIRKGWPIADIWERIGDLVGFRIVCQNLKDVYRVRDLILADKRFELKGDVEDRIAHPDSSGYRAVQFNVVYNLKISDKARPISIICEIQIKTMLQDSWASLTHRDIYKEGAHLPKEIMILSRRLSELLATADDIAQDIRDQVSSPAIISKADKKSKKGEVGRFNLSFIFKSKYKKDIPEYLLTQAINKCHELGLYRLDGLDSMLSDSDFLDSLNNEHKRFFHADISEEVVFLLALTAAARGKEIAVKEGIKRFREEYEEIVAIAQREECALPDSLEELIDDLKPKTKDDLIDNPLFVERLARRFGAIGECLICGSIIVKVEDLVEEILDYYAKDDQKFRDILTREFLNCGVETGGFENSSICAYHDEITKKP